MLYILYGEDDFSLHEVLAQIKAEVGSEASASTNITVLQVEDITPQQLKATCNTVPFLAPKRLVIVEGLLSLFEPKPKVKRIKKPDDSGWSSLIDYGKLIPESTILVLVDGKLTKKNPMLRDLAPQASTREFKPISIPFRGTRKGDELYVWIQNTTERRGANISLSAIQSLIELVGNNLWFLSSEIDKLCLYANGRIIEERDVRSLVAEAHVPNVFAMVDSILEGKLAAANRLLNDMEKDGAEPSYLLFMIARQFRIVIQVKDLLQRKQTREEIRHTLGIKEEFILNKTVSQAKMHSMNRLKMLYRKLLDADISIKTGKLKGELALEILIYELCDMTVA